MNLFAHATAALLELFAGTTAARFVSADLGDGASFGQVEFEATFVGSASCLVGDNAGRSGDRHVALGHGAFVASGGALGGIGKDGLHGLHGGEAEEVVDRSFIDGVHEGGEELVSLHLVFHERILLALGAELDTFAEGVHGIEVLLPFLVDGIEHDVSFERIEMLGGLHFDLALVGSVDAFEEERGVALNVAGFELGLLDGEMEGEGLIHPVKKFDEVRLTIVALFHVVGDL